jgi:hypothetical protein
VAVRIRICIGGTDSPKQAVVTKSPSTTRASRPVSAIPSASGNWNALTAWYVLTVYCFGLRHHSDINARVETRDERLYRRRPRSRGLDMGSIVDDRKEFTVLVTGFGVRF